MKTLFCACAGVHAKRGIRASAGAHAHLHVLTRSSPTAAVHTLLVALFLFLSLPPPPPPSLHTHYLAHTVRGIRVQVLLHEQPDACTAAPHVKTPILARERAHSLKLQPLSQTSTSGRRERKVPTPHTHTQRANTRPPPSHSPTQPSTHGDTQDQPQTSTYAHTAARAPSHALPASQAFESGACDHERDSAAEPDSMALHTKRTRNARMVRPSADSALAAQASPAAWQTRGILRALAPGTRAAPRRAAPRTRTRPPQRGCPSVPPHLPPPRCSLARTPCTCLHTVDG
jgi:hypothetical protein